ncbi:uncharacterized protein LOC118766390 [Octopus sinensis]|uniref:Uncharacterized protein LOC118766390 n=1 Tax=Octopus sinensis TaxID=2607531 RepID=A0A7E6FD68_9MOLL|nr:uncharacterized protein LOC118766390 [Octopus sinensis]
MSIFSTKQDSIKMKTIFLLLALFVIGITADGSCPEKAKDMCSKSMDMSPEEDDENSYCKRVEYFSSCLAKVNHGCSDYFDRIYVLLCQGNSTDSLHGIMKSHIIILMVSIISALV